MLIVSGCASLPPGSGFARKPSHALGPSVRTPFGLRFDGAARGHDGKSAFRLLSVGVYCFLFRAQTIEAATRTIDLEYFIFRQDDTGQLLTDALSRAADRGVRIRLPVDDADRDDEDEQFAEPRAEILRRSSSATAGR